MRVVLSCRRAGVLALCIIILTGPAPMVQADPGTYVRVEPSEFVPVLAKCTIRWDYDFGHDTIIWAEGPSGRIEIIHDSFPGDDNYFVWRGTNKWGAPLAPGLYTITVEPQDEWSGYAKSDSVRLLPQPNPWEPFGPRFSSPPFTKVDVWLADGWVEYHATVEGGVRSPASLAWNGEVYWLEIETPTGSELTITPEGEVSASAAVSKTTESGVGLGPEVRSVNYWIAHHTEINELKATNWGLDYYFDAEQKIIRVVQVREWVVDALVVVAVIGILGEFAVFLLPYLPALQGVGGAAPLALTPDAPEQHALCSASGGCSSEAIDQILGPGMSTYCSCLHLSAPGLAYAGQDIVISGDGFTPGGDVSLLLGLPGESEPRSWPAVRCANDGTFTSTLHLDADWPTGDYAILAFDNNQIEVATAQCLENGNLSDFVIRMALGTCNVVRDTVPPISRSSLNPAEPDGLNDWWVSHTAVSLAAEDEGLGVVSTWWRLDGGPWSVYEEPFRVEDGVHELEFYSEDAAGNAETIRCQEVRVDTVAPEVVCEGATDWSNQPTVLTITAHDDTSGVASVAFRDSLEAGQFSSGDTLDAHLTAEGRHELVYWAADNAGNSSQELLVRLGLDYCPPIVSAVPLEEPNALDWYNAPVTVSFGAEDPPLADGSEGSGVKWVSSAATVDEDGTDLSVLGQAEDEAGNTGETQIRVNVDMTPPKVLIEIDGGPLFMDNEILTYTVSSGDELSGLLATELTLDGNSLDGSPIPLWTVPLGEHELVARAVDRAGNVALTRVEFATSTSLQSLVELKHRFLEMGWISSGISKSLDAKLDAAARAASRENENAWRAGIEAFIREVYAQSGKHIDCMASGVLLRDAQALLDQGPGFLDRR